MRVDPVVVADLNRSGLSDAEIARRLLCSREAITWRRRKLGLPSNKGSEFHRRMLSQGVQKAYRRLGIWNSCEFRLAKMAQVASEEGWPESINGRPLGTIARKILSLLWEYGPQTIRQLCERLGKRPPRREAHGLKNGPKSCLAELERAGLITNLGQIGNDGKRGHATRVYSIALHVERNQKIV